MDSAPSMRESDPAQSIGLMTEEKHGRKRSSHGSSIPKILELSSSALHSPRTLGRY